MLLVLGEILLISFAGNLFLWCFQRKVLAQLAATKALLKQERQAALFGVSKLNVSHGELNAEAAVSKSYLACLRDQLAAALACTKAIDFSTLNEEWADLDKTNTLALVRYRIFQTEWDAIHSPHAASQLWDQLFETLTSVLNRGQQPPVLGNGQLIDFQAAYEELNKNSEFYRQRVETLESFRSLYFELEENFNELVAENEQLSEQLLEKISDRSDRAALQIILKNYKLNQDKLVNRLRQQQIIINAANQEARSHLPGDLTEREEILFLANPQYALAKHDINQLQKAEQEQRSLIEKIRMHSQDSAYKDDLERVVAEQEKELKQLEASLNNSKNCIRTLEMSLDEATMRIQTFEAENTKLSTKVKDMAFMETTIMQFSQDSAQMIDCIQTLEASLNDLCEEKELRMQQLDELEKEVRLKDLELNKVKADIGKNSLKP